MSSNISTTREIENKKTEKVPWSTWADYKKSGLVETKQVEGEPLSDYACLGDHLYSEHAVQRMCPSGNRYGSSIEYTSDTKKATSGRSIPTGIVEEILKTSDYTESRGRREYRCGDVVVITSRDGSAVITVEYQHD